MKNRFNRIWAVPIFAVVLIGLYYVPPIHTRLSWRLEWIRTEIKYFINPPEEAVFQPQQQSTGNIAVTQTLQTPKSTPTPIPSPTVQPTITATSLPAACNRPRIPAVRICMSWGWRKAASFRLRRKIPCCSTPSARRFPMR